MSTTIGEDFERMREDGRELGLMEAQAIALAYAVETGGEARQAANVVAGRIELARARFELERERRKLGGAPPISDQIDPSNGAAMADRRARGAS